MGERTEEDGIRQGPGGGDWLLIAACGAALWLVNGVWLISEFPNASMQLACAAPGPTRASEPPLNPRLMMTWEPAAIVGGVGATAGCVPWVTTSGS